MAKKREHLLLIRIAAYTTFLARSALGEILSFGPNALPNCAYQCSALYSAQYDCQNNLKCFCLSSYVGGLFQGTWACNEACSRSQDRAAVEGWFKGLCAKYMRNSEQANSGGNVGNNNNQTSSVTPIVYQGSGSNESTRITHWWHKNWYWFLLVFLAIAIPIISYALYFPTRKWLHKQRIARRQRRPLPPLSLSLPPTDPNLSTDPESTAQAITSVADGERGILMSPALRSPPIDPPTALDDTIEPAERANRHSSVYLYRNQLLLPLEAVGSLEASSGAALTREDELVVEAAVHSGTVQHQSWENQVREEYKRRRRMSERIQGVWKKGERREERREEKVV